MLLPAWSYLFLKFDFNPCISFCCIYIHCILFLVPICDVKMCLPSWTNWFEARILTNQSNIYIYMYIYIYIYICICMYGLCKLNSRVLGSNVPQYWLTSDVRGTPDVRMTLSGLLLRNCSITPSVWHFYPKHKAYVNSDTVVFLLLCFYR